jgi:hypothetical protein
MLLTAVLIAAGVITAVLTTAGSTTASIANRQKSDTAKALAAAQAGLIGYATNDANRPGSLPCPDTDNDGSADLYAGAECPGYVASSNVYLGRLPWRTLGLTDLRDASGERLWYAVSRDFARNPTCSPTCPLTSDTRGQLTVTGSAPVNYAIAVVFAPGQAVANQLRNAANQNTAAHFLEGENADGNNATFDTAAASTTFNDQLLAVTSFNLMPPVEQRVAREMIRYLNGYRAATGVYPWADLGDGNSNGDIVTPAAYNRNRFPCGNALPTNWGSGGTPVLPAWLANGCASVTGWAGVIYYAVAKNRLQNGGASCGPPTQCSASTLSVTNSGGRVATQCTTANPPVCTVQKIITGSADLVLLTAGGTTASPRGTWSTTAWTTITGYFVDTDATVSSENRDNNDDNYYVPTATDSNRARMFIVR